MFECSMESDGSSESRVRYHSLYRLCRMIPLFRNIIRFDNQCIIFPILISRAKHNQQVILNEEIG